MVIMVIVKYERWTRTYFYLLSTWFWWIPLPTFKFISDIKDKVKKMIIYSWCILESFNNIYVILNTFSPFSLSTSLKECNEREKGYLNSTYYVLATVLSTSYIFIFCVDKMRLRQSVLLLPLVTWQMQI